MYSRWLTETVDGEPSVPSAVLFGGVAMIRVLQVVNNMHRAGLETMLMNYYRRIDRSEIQFDFLTHRPDKGDYDDEITSLGGRVYYAPRLYPQNYPKYFAYMKDFFLKHPEYKIVHSHIDAMSYLPLLAAKRAKVPVRIAHSHNTSMDRDFKYLLKRYFMKRLPGVATDLFACGEDAGHFQFGDRAFTLVKNAIDASNFAFNQEIRGAVRDELGLKDAFVIGHVGRFTHQKNHEFLIRVFDELQKQVENAVLLLIGVGEMLDAVKEQIGKLGLGDKVRLLGNRGDVNKLYQAMDVFVLPSFYEGVPVVGIEAQYANLPCLFSDKVPRESAFSKVSSFISIDDGTKPWIDALVRFANEKAEKKSAMAKNPDTDKITTADKNTDRIIRREAAVDDKEHDINYAYQMVEKRYLRMAADCGAAAAAEAAYGTAAAASEATSLAPLRIAMLGHKRVPSREGGVEVVVENLSVRMAKLGNDVCLYNRSGHHISGADFDNKETLKEYRGVRMKKVLTVHAKGLAAMTASVMATLHAAFGHFDVVHFHAEGSCVFCFLPKLFGKRCIVTIHGLDWKREKWQSSIGKVYIRLGERMAAHFADEIIVLGQSDKDYFKNTYGRETHLIPNGVSKPKRAAADRITELYGLEKDGYLLFLSRLVPEKGLRYLISAYKQTETDKRLVIAGCASDSDDFADEMKEMAASDERIIFTGFVEGVVLQELYDNAYIYVLPSDLEGMPLTLLEAMSYGNCVLTSDIPECTEVTRGHGAVFKKGDTEDLRVQLERLLSDEALVRKYKNGAAAFILGQYNWDDVVAKTLVLYRNNASHEEATGEHIYGEKERYIG